ncbi:hypothetical protein THRCLA_22841, partial [Thraustotheca clavata]
PVPSAQRKVMLLFKTATAICQALPTASALLQSMLCAKRSHRVLSVACGQPRHQLQPLQAAPQLQVQPQLVAPQLQAHLRLPSQPLLLQLRPVQLRLLQLLPLLPQPQPSRLSVL